MASRKHIKVTHRPTNKELFAIKVTSLQVNVTERSLWNYYSQFGEISSVILKSSSKESYAYINFNDKSSAKKAQQLTNGRKVLGSIVSVILKTDESACTIVPPIRYILTISNLSDNVNESELEDICSQFNGFQSLVINPGYAYVNFTNRESAQKAMEHMNKLNLNGQEITVKFHQPELQPVTSQPYQPPFQPPPLPFQHPPPVLSQFLPVISQRPPMPCLPPPPMPCKPPKLPFKHPQHSPSTLSSLTTCTIKVTINGNGINRHYLDLYFRQYGQIVSIHVGTSNFAYITYNTTESAIAACKISKFILNGITIMVKLSVQEDINKDDPFVSHMTGTLRFTEVEEKSDKAVVITSCENEDVVSFHSDKAKLAESIINLLIASQTCHLHCKYIPLLVDPTLFQKVAHKHVVEFSILVKDGTSKTLLDFSRTVAAVTSLAEPHLMTLDTLSEYLTPSLSKSSNNSLWYVMDDTETYIAMSPFDSAAVERQYQSGATGYHSIGNWEYSYNFHTMTQTNLSTLKTHSITRTTPSCKVNNITVRCQGLSDIIPKALDALQHDLDQHVTCLPLEICKMDEKSLTVLASSFCVEVESSSEDNIIILKGKKSYLEKVLVILQKKRSQLQAKHLTLNCITSNMSYPSEWEPQSDDIELKSVLHDSNEWSEIEANMRISMPGVHLIKIERIQNKRLWERYDFSKKTQYIKNDGIINEMSLFHGSKNNPPKKIYCSEHGFDFRFSNAGRWGKGAYFAIDASYSANFAYKSSSGWQILLAYVLTGHSKLMNPDSKMVAPPIKEGCNDEQRYDSVNGYIATKYGTHHKIYVIYDHDKTYPAYLITFHCCFNSSL